ncbi:hypothetical protein HanIR_Chr13g0618251 [Helianthus annuus]|nr:hypothetical protein HanIR_Chr13g0618251 [Helianthus annuus]
MCSRSVIFMGFCSRCKNGENEKNSDLDLNIQICDKTSVGFYVFLLKVQVFFIKIHVQVFSSDLQILHSSCVLEVLDIFIFRKILTVPSLKDQNFISKGHVDSLIFRKVKFLLRRINYLLERSSLSQTNFSKDQKESFVSIDHICTSIP